MFETKFLSFENGILLYMHSKDFTEQSQACKIQSGHRRSALSSVHAACELVPAGRGGEGRGKAVSTARADWRGKSGLSSSTARLFLDLSLTHGPPRAPETGVTRFVLNEFKSASHAATLIQDCVT